LATGRSTRRPCTAAPSTKAVQQLAMNAAASGMALAAASGTPISPMRLAETPAKRSGWRAPLDRARLTLARRWAAMRSKRVAPGSRTAWRKPAAVTAGPGAARNWRLLMARICTVESGPWG
jgi:hypothetical protein